MARDDYFIIVYKILIYLYECLKTGQDIDVHSVLTAETYGIEQSYFEYIIAEICKEGYISGVNIIPITGAKRNGVKITSSLEIKPKGIEYLQENSTLAKAKKAIKDIKDIIPRIIK